ncbi:hypothetical protein GSI_13277 [Ganoderma sinense ZZ0214-1]|uniref:F-box domain-containing protein n=1 Tax=Ganoderma sinense ZZ0214-1 TaxID=1077348 RepID=A0A2G8RV48_9APHY|nr:hypothetical protein GSI_13277 [Ganoderma sinense ZZ0214-1]
MLTDDPGVTDAIASLHCIRSLSIESSYTAACSLISKIGSPLRKLDLSCFQCGSDVEYSWYPAAFRGSFSRLARTLQELSFSSLFVDLDIIQRLHLQEFDRPAPPLSSWQQYPAVRSLSVKFFTGRLLLEPLQHLFPALDRTLSVGIPNMTDSPEDTFLDARAINLRVQDVNNSGDGSRPARGWTKLDRVDCGPAVLYILALRCPIRFAVINGIYRMHGPELERDWLSVSLRENPVPRLSLGLRLENELAGLRGVFGPEMGATLTHLTLALNTNNRITYWPDPPPEISYGWRELLDKVLSSLAPLRKLTHLRLALHSESTDDAASDTFEPLTPEQELQRAVHPSLFDFDGTAGALARLLSASLRFLSLTTSGRFLRLHPDTYAGDLITPHLPYGKDWAVSRAWSVSFAGHNVDADGVQNGPPSEPILVELRDEEAEKIMRREELILPDGSYEKPWLTPDAD